MKVNKYEKIGYYFYFCFDLFVGLSFIYNIATNQEKWDRHNASFFGFILGIIFTTLGIVGLLLLEKRYKYFTIESNLSTEFKRKIMTDLLNELGQTNHNIYENNITFSYKENLFTADYNIYINFDKTFFYLLVQKDFSYRGMMFGDGVIDLFGQTKKVNQDITYSLTKLINSNNNVQQKVLRQQG